MQRRTFLTAVIASPLLALVSLAPAEAKPAPRRVFIQRSQIAGFKYHDGPKVWPYLEQGQQLTLQREPYNQYDKRAVAVYWQGHKVGYVPRHENRVIAQMLDKNEKLEAQITMLRIGNIPWVPWQFRVEVVV